MIRLLAVVAIVFGAGPAWALTFERCGRSQTKSASEAVQAAAELAGRAAANVADSPEFLLWFGEFRADRGEEVRSNLKAMHAMLLGDEVKAVCLSQREIDCKDGTYAFVMFERPGAIQLCPSFFAMPSMQDLRAGVGYIDDGTREGTIIHEISHFPTVAGTGDECYGRGTCSLMASRDPRRAIATADSYQYFAEDVTLTFWIQSSD